MSNQSDTAARPTTAQRVAQHRGVMPKRGSVCPNCDEKLKGPFCHVCGQDTDDRRRPMTALIEEAVEGLLQLDSRLIRTLPLLFFRPGVLARDYLEGRIARHMPPFKVFLIALVIYIFGFGFGIDNQAWMSEPFAAKNSGSVAVDTIRAGAKSQVPDAMTLAGAERERALSSGVPAATAEAEFQAALAAAAKRRDRLSSFADRLESGNPPPKAKNFSEAFIIQWHRALTQQAAFFDLTGTWLYRLSFLLLPVTALIFGLANLGNRRFLLVDHLVVAMIFLSFGFLAVTPSVFLPKTGYIAWSVLASVWGPINLFQLLRGAYKLSVGAAIFKTFVVSILGGAAFLVLTLAALILAAMSL